MRALRISEVGGPEVLALETVDDPVPEPGDLLVRLEAVGVNFIEVYQRKGLYKRPMPFTPGTEGAGTVVAVGSEVRDVRVGDRVASIDFRGTYAELAVVRADRAVTLPEGLSARSAAAAMLQGMTAHYLATSVHALQPGEACLVHAAAGGVGLLLCQIAKRRTAIVIGTVSTPEKA
jgi:NADPH2:quinone reductase